MQKSEVKDLLEMIYTGKMTDAKTIAAILAYAQKEGIRQKKRQKPVTGKCQ